MTTVNALMAQNIGNAMTNIKTWEPVSFNVLEYGLKGDGVTDDTTALQVLINKAIAAGRRTILFPKGSYYVTSLTNADKVDFVGDNSQFVGGYAGAITNLGEVAALKAETEQQFETTEQQLSQMTQNITFHSGIRKPLVTFIDDDGVSPVYTRLLPLFRSKGIVGNAAVITGKIGVSGYITASQLREMYDAGWEMLGHTYSHNPNLSIYPDDADLDYELGAGCKTILENLGFKVNGFVYPQGVSDVRIRSFTRKYYTYSFGDTGVNKGDFINSMNIKRVPLGSFTPVGQNTLEYYKSQVDDAIANNGWIVFMTHVSATYEGMDETQWQHISDLIDYIKSQNVDIVTTSEGYKYFGNKIFVGDLETDYFIANEKGTFRSRRDGSTLVKKITKESKLPSDGLATFEKNSITVMDAGNAWATTNGLPVGAGTLFTYYLVTDFSANATFNRQEYWINGRVECWIRYATSINAWSAWEKQGTTPVTWVGTVTMNHTAFAPLGITKCTQYVDFARLYSSSGAQPTLSKPAWAASEISTNSSSPTIIGTAGSINLQAYRDVNNIVNIKYDVGGNNYPMFVRTAFL